MAIATRDQYRAEPLPFVVVRRFAPRWSMRP
jgi:hypothetical protein